MRPRITRLLVAPVLLVGGTLAVVGCGGSPGADSAGTTATATTASPVAEAVEALNDPSTGLSTAWAKSGGGGGTAADLAPPSVILAPGYTCALVVTDTGVTLFLQEPGDRLPTVFDWTKSGGVVSQPSVPASAPKGGTPCTLSDDWQVALK
jgi:hypothetical protein